MRDVAREAMVIFFTTTVDIRTRGPVVKNSERRSWKKLGEPPEANTANNATSFGSRRGAYSREHLQVNEYFREFKNGLYLVGCILEEDSC